MVFLIKSMNSRILEFYHYIKDYEAIKKQPYICCLSSLKNVNEKRASRFAAELLLPEDALRSEIKYYRNESGCSDKKDLTFDEYAAISAILTLKYQMPLKAIIYRLHEEGYIDNIEKFLKEYDVIKRMLMQIKILKPHVEHLYKTGNQAIDNRSILYRQMEIAYKNGQATRQEITEDADVLGLDIDVIDAFFDIINDADEDERYIEA